MDFDRLVTRDLALVLLHPESGQRLKSGMEWRLAVAGSAVTDLLLAERVRLTAPGEPGIKEGRIVPVLGGVEMPGPWRDAVARADGRTPKDAIQRIAGGLSARDRAGALWDDVLDRLHRQEVIAVTEEKVLGMVPRRKVALLEPEVRSAVVRRIEETLDGSLPPTDRTIALVGVLVAIGVLPKILPERPKAWLKDRSRVVAEASLGSAALTRAIRELQAATATAAAVGGAVS